MSLLLKCLGFKISDYLIPEFEIPGNSLCRIRMPFTMESFGDRELISLLTNEKVHRSIKFGNIRPIYSGKINREHGGIFHIFKPRKTVNKLSRYYGKDKRDIISSLSTLNIELNSSWNKIPLFNRYLLSFETASICSNFLFFDTTGLDPIGIEKMYEHATEKRKKGYTIVHLFYPILSDELSNEEDEFIVFF